METQPKKIVKRASIILMTADGHGVRAIMHEVGVSKTTVWRWQEYFAEAGVEGLVEGRSKPPGRKPISAAIKLNVVEKTVKERPVNATHWSWRTLAKEMRTSHTSVQLGRTRSQAASRQKFQDLYRSKLRR